VTAHSQSSQIEALPESLRELAETLGLRMALKLIRHFGGTEIKPPKKPAADHPIVVALGNEDASALCSYLHGGLMYVPHMRARRSVRSDVLNLQAGGKERREIARMLGISQRHVRRMANKPAPPQYQIDLFADE